MGYSDTLVCHYVSIHVNNWLHDVIKNAKLLHCMILLNLRPILILVSVSVYH